MKVVDFKEPGGSNVLMISAREKPSARDHEVVIKVIAAGVNGPDLMQRRGLYPPPKGASDLLGLEVSGEVTAIGSSVTNWRIGDKVCALANGGGYAEYVAVHEDHCLPIPKGVSLIDAAGLPETYFTVWSNIFMGFTLPNRANFLVHGGAGGIGSTAIQLGVALGHQVFTTISCDEASDFCKRLGAFYCINHRQEDFVDILRDHGGANIILDIIGRDYIPRNIKAAAPDGRIVQLAFQQGSKVEMNLMPIMLKRLTFTGSTLRSRSDKQKGAIAKDLRQNVWPLFDAGKLKPVTHAIFDFTDVKRAHDTIEQGGHHGKILLKMP